MSDQVTLLARVLDRLLPGDGVDWPAAGRHGLGPRTRELLLDAPDGGEALAVATTRLGASFKDDAAADEMDAALRRFETEDPQNFERLLTAAYNAYYTDPGIRDVIERLTGYENRPPQPLGYALEPFDERLLANVKKRKPFWRADGET